MDARGAIAVAAGAAVWGLFWIPLRWIESAGLSGLVVVAIANATAAIALIAFTGKPDRADLTKALRNPQAILIGATLGASSVLYMLALLHTDVVRAVFLFYLLPIWAALAARCLYAEPITPRQSSAIVLTVAGVWLLLGGSAEQLQVRPGFGDSLAIAAGMTWGLGLAILGSRTQLSASKSSLATFVGATVFALSIVAILHLLPASLVDSVQTAPHGSQTSAQTSMPPRPAFALAMTLAFGLFLLLPSVASQVWGAERLPASTAAMLTTTEILVATASAVWLIGSSVDASGAVGAGLIALAILQTLRPNKASQR